MNNCFIILASGQSKRFKSPKLKQYSIYKNKALYEHSIDKAINSKLFKYIVLVVKNKKQIKKKYKKNVIIINGGKERSDSSLIALKRIKRFKPKNVLIHDAARPNFSKKLLKNLINSLDKNKAVVPALKSKDSIKYNFQNKLYNLKRDNSLLTQTPQAFRFNDLYKISINNKNTIQDEASLFIENDIKIKFINGENFNSKITYKEDFNLHKTYYGIGFDIHRLVPKKKLYLAGIKIPFTLGTLGHSDGDPVLHAITDSILGACRMGDIGEKFSDKSKKFKNIRSTILLKKIIEEIKSKGFFINNIDINIILQKPKIQKFKKDMISCISKICDIQLSQINIKGKTTEKLGLIGKEKAIACEVITSVTKYV